MTTITLDEDVACHAPLTVAQATVIVESWLAAPNVATLDPGAPTTP